MFAKIFIKPVGFSCNISCKYCYNNVNSCRTAPSHSVMNLDTFALIIKSLLPYMGEKFQIVYHGGEPMLAGQQFYFRTTELLKNIVKGKLVKQFIQTNATLVDDSWAKIFRDLEILPSTSLDGPKELHNLTRIDFNESGTYERALGGYWKLRNVVGFCGALGVINRHNWNKAAIMFHWLVENNIRTIDFLPCAPQRGFRNNDLWVTPEQASEFYIQLFDLWFTLDNPDIRIRIFYDAIKGVLGGTPKVCSYRPDGCKKYLSFDINGDAYHCGRYDVYKETCLGNIHNDGIEMIIEEKLNGHIQREITVNQEACKKCKWVESCGGGCPFLKYSERGNFKGVFSYCSTRLELFEHVKQKVLLKNG